MFALRQVPEHAQAVRRRERAGRLFGIHHGVYALVPRRLLSREGRWLAAVLACGDRAALSHRSAAHLHELRATTRSGIEVIVVGRTARRHPGIELHRSANLTTDDLTEVHGIPVTTVARTLLDLAAVVPLRHTACALHRAELLGVLHVRAIARLLAAWRAAGGPEPECNAYVDPGDRGPPLRPDFVWRDANVAVDPPRADADRQPTLIVRRRP
ncbi:MAG TPA: hypothetical protein VFW09_07005 [Solirubrobacteraceae bacterium]|nr:hypothetical protein [Solirubrobacteraceae bacterium]